MPATGSPTSASAAETTAVILQSLASADGNGTVADFTGLAGAILLEVVNTGTGSTTLAIEGSFDGVTWYACGYYQIDGNANPTRAAGDYAVTASPFAHILSLADSYYKFRARLHGTTGTVALTATLRGFAA